MREKTRISGKAIKDEICRIKSEEGEKVLVDKAVYLLALHELKVLRFKLCQKKYWKQATDEITLTRGN